MMNKPAVCCNYPKCTRHAVVRCDFCDLEACEVCNTNHGIEEEDLIIAPDWRGTGSTVCHECRNEAIAEVIDQRDDYRRENRSLLDQKASLESELYELRRLHERTQSDG